jgi:hypothetical protein
LVLYYDTKTTFYNSYSYVISSSTTTTMTAAGTPLAKEKPLKNLTRRDIPPLVAGLLDPSNRNAHDKRKGQLTRACYQIDDVPWQDSPFFEYDCVMDTFEGTQFADENHRRWTPYLMELFRSYRKPLMEGIDRDANEDTGTIVETLMSGDRVQYDFAIIGSGPHGAAFASTVRELYPSMKILMVEANKRLGGQWRNFGDKPVYAMNSRVRRADRRLPSLPRTRGNINLLGRYSPLELSDVVQGQYAMNTEMGDVTAINGFLSATDMLVGTQVVSVRGGREMTVQLPDETRWLITTRRGVVDATGISTQSVFEESPSPNYFTSGRFYEHFGTHPMPLQRFHDLDVMVIGGGDSALTVLEALLGCLPAETYGPMGVGRLRPRRIRWVGAPAATRREVEACLRSRYKNGIVQAVREDQFDTEALIVPTIEKATLLSAADRFVEVFVGLKYEYPNVVIDCTTMPVRRKEAVTAWNPMRFVGPLAPGNMTDSTIARIEQLGVPENTVSLWATMERTIEAAIKLGGG